MVVVGVVVPGPAGSAVVSTDVDSDVISMVVVVVVVSEVVDSAVVSMVVVAVVDSNVVDSVVV